MPQGWRHHWDRRPPLSDDAAAERDKIINSLGNLTLVTKKLNGSLSHGRGPTERLGKLPRLGRMVAWGSDL